VTAKREETSNKGDKSLQEKQKREKKKRMSEEKVGLNMDDNGSLIRASLSLSLSLSLSPTL